MKRVWVAVFVWLVTGVMFHAFAYSEENQEMAGGEPGEEQGMMMGGPMGGSERTSGGRYQGFGGQPADESVAGGMKGKHMMGPMMGGMPSMVATSDGGVIVMAGSKLMKYSSSLTLVKEVELKPGKGPKSGAQMRTPQSGAMEDMPEEGMSEEMPEGQG